MTALCTFLVLSTLVFLIEYTTGISVLLNKYVKMQLPTFSVFGVYFTGVGYYAVTSSCGFLF